MAEITLTVESNPGDTPAGRELRFSQWSATFDHAALVAAGRSRADGFDLHMRYVGTAMVFGGNPVPMCAFDGLNTAACAVTFNTITDVVNGMPDDGYRVVFGDLGWQASRATFTPGMNGADLGVTAAVVPALTLPPPSRPLPRSKVIDVLEVGPPDFRVVRTRLMGNPARRSIAVEWRDPSAEDFYEIRAWNDAHAGGAGSMPTVAWMTTLAGFTAATVRAVPGTLAMTQRGRRRYDARMTIEEWAA